MKMKSAILAVAFAASTFALPAVAQMNMSAFYVGATVGQSKFKNACDGTTGSCDDKDTAWRILAGYQLNRNFAVEAGYHDLGEAKASGAGVNASISTKLGELLAVGMLPIANQFSLYGKLGGYYAKSEGTSNVGVSADEKNSGLTYGAGAQWDPMANLGVRLEWQQYHDVGGDSLGGKDNIDVLSVGAIWRFR
jgi:OmpA-OmpF porin, OOP family